jgi:hypothetical protein
MRILRVDSIHVNVFLNTFFANINTFLRIDSKSVSDKLIFSFNSFYILTDVLHDGAKGGFFETRFIKIFFITEIFTKSDVLRHSLYKNHSLVQG